MSLAFSLALLLAAGSAPTEDSSGGLAESLVRRIEQRHARTKDLEARFIQSYRSGLLGRELVERGVVSDGQTFYFYVPEDRQVIVQEQDEQRSLAARLLFGQGGLLDEFEATLEEPFEEGVLRLRLDPRSEDSELERAYIDLEPSGLVRSILLEDLQGNRTRFRFEDVRENRGLADRLFRFEIPPGVEVIRG
jgi:outer membrane lipoprotein-sorting protein